MYELLEYENSFYVIYLSEADSSYKYSLKVKLVSSGRVNLHILQAFCCIAVKHCAYFVPLEKYPQHTISMLAGVFLRAPRIHNPFLLFATIFVKYAG